MTEPETHAVLIVRSSRMSYALPLDQVVETMRPLPVRPFAGMPASVRGMAVVRGETVPVIDVGRLLGSTESEPTRYIAVRADGRTVALAVDGTVSIASFHPAAWRELPPLAREMHAGFIERIGVVDRELSVLLNTMRMVPDGLWQHLAREPGP